MSKNKNRQPGSARLKTFKVPQQHRPTTVAANPDLWSDESKRSYSFHYGATYTDIPYQCRHCRADCVFTAQDQQYTYEVKKASINERRFLCEPCWLESHRIREALRGCEASWAQSKPALKTDREFLIRWLELLQRLETYVPYRADTAKKAMLAKLLANTPAGP